MNGPRVSLPKALLAAAIAIYVAWFGLFTCGQHDRFATFAYDLGTFDQGVWLAGRGKSLFVTVRGLPLLGDHVRLFSFVLAPLYFLWDDVRALLVLQTVAIAAGAWFLWRIAARELPGRPWLALAIAAGWLLHPAVQNLNLDHAHPDAFASTLILASIDFLGAGRPLAFSMAAALAMSCKEDVPLVFVAMGFALMVDPARRRTGAVLAASAGLYFAACMLVILPAFNGVGFFRFGYPGFFAGMGDHGHDPSWYVERLLRRESFVYLWQVGLPNLFLFVLSPLRALPALPALTANLLSDTAYTRSLDFHYQTSVLPFLYLATTDAIAKILRFVEGRAAESRVAAGVALALVAAVVSANLAWSQASLAHPGLLTAVLGDARHNPKVAELRGLLAKIPRGAVVAADYSLVPHLSHRDGIYMLPNPFHPSGWGVSDDRPDDSSSVEYLVLHRVHGREPIQALVDDLVTEGRFARIAGDEDAGLYRRISWGPPGEHASCGDWTGDGVVAEDDARRIGNAIAKGADCPLRICDADGDGVAATADVLRLGKRLREPATELRCPR